MTTPEALRELPSGVTVPCQYGGNFHARLNNANLRIEWLQCAQDGDEFYTTTLSGPIRVKLLEPSFTPEAVAAIRAGNARRDVIWTRHYTDPESPQSNTLSYNFKMTGLIATKQLFGQGLFIGPFSYRLDGFIRGESEWINSSERITSFDSATDAVVRGSREYSDGNTVVTETLHLVKGTMFSETSSPWDRRVRRYSARRFRTYNRIDYNDFVTVTADHTIDGRLTIEYLEGYSPACISGEYSIKTRVPVHTPSLFTSSSAYDRGEIALNNAARVRFYSPANVPPRLPAPQGDMLTTIKVKDVGLFSYDSDPTAPNSLFNFPMCF